MIKSFSRPVRKISPPWRSVLGLLFLYPILRRINKQAKYLGLATLPAGAIFISWALLSILSYANKPLLAIASFASVFALLPAQRTANLINRTAVPAPPINNRFTGLNWLALVLGGPIFALTLLGLVVQGVQT